MRCLQDWHLGRVACISSSVDPPEKLDLFWWLQTKSAVNYLMCTYSRANEFNGSPEEHSCGTTLTIGIEALHDPVLISWSTRFCPGTAMQSCFKFMLSSNPPSACMWASLRSVSPGIISSSVRSFLLDQAGLDLTESIRPTFHSAHTLSISWLLPHTTTSIGWWAYYWNAGDILGQEFRPY